MVLYAHEDGNSYIVLVLELISKYNYSLDSYGNVKMLAQENINDRISVILQIRLSYLSISYIFCGRWLPELILSLQLVGVKLLLRSSSGLKMAGWCRIQCSGIHSLILAQLQRRRE